MDESTNYVWCDKRGEVQRTERITVEVEVDLDANGHMLGTRYTLPFITANGNRTRRDRD